MSNAEGIIKCCVKTELMLDELSVSFATTKLHIKVNLETALQIEEIAVENSHAYQVHEQAKLNLISCLCVRVSMNACNYIEDPTLSQNSKVLM